MHKTVKIDKHWTLFLDRDGVINKKLPDDYVTSWERFEFLPGVFEALSLLKEVFGKVIIITNQQGIGKGLMTTQELISIHNKMLNLIEQNGGKIDKIYFCPDIDSSGSINRKPAIGMALQAKHDFPEIDFSQTIMVGDSLSDMEFAKKIGAISVFISDHTDELTSNKSLADYVFNNLYEFSKFVYENRCL